MHDPDIPPQRGPATTVAAGLAILALALACGLFVAGWLYGSRPLMVPVPGLPAVAPRTLVAFVIAASALLVRLRGGDRATAAAMAFAVAGTAGLSSAQIFWDDIPWRSNRMALSTEFGFYALAFVLLAYDATDLRLHRLARAVALAGLVWVAPPVAGLIAGNPGILRHAPWHKMAPQTAVLFLLVFGGLVVGLTERRRQIR